MHPKPLQMPSPRRAHFSQHESDGRGRLDETLLRAAMADQAALQQEQQWHQQASPSRLPNAGSASVSISPFLPGYSLTAPSLQGSRDGQRAQLALPASPMQVHRREGAAPSPDRIMTESPSGEDGLVRESIVPSHRVQLKTPTLTEDDDDEDETEESRPSAWTSCRDRRPTSANVTPVAERASWIADECEGPPTTSLGSNAGYLSNKRPSIQQSRPYVHASHFHDQQPAMPHQPQQAHAQGRATSKDMFIPLDAQLQGFRFPSGSAGSSIHGSTPHVQHYNPLSSPSMVQPYTPRSASGSSSFNKLPQTTLKPSLVRHQQSYQNMVCELGMAGTEDEHGHPQGARGGLRSALAGLYGRVVSSEQSRALESSPESPKMASRPPLRRGSSAQSLSGLTLREQRDSEASDVDEKHNLDYLSRRRKSMAFILGEDDEPREADDPRYTGMERKSVDMRKGYTFADNRRASYSSEYCDPDVRQRPRSRSLANIMAPLKGFGSNMDKMPRQMSNHSSMRAHMAERQKLILKLARALMLFGAPSHRVESQLNALSQVLAVDGQFIHFPGIVIASFGDIDTHTSECHFVKSKTDLALGHLTEVHNVYKGVISDRLTVQKGTEELNRLLKAPPEWSILSRVAFNAIRCGIMAPMSFGGSFVDAFLAGAFGGLLTFTQLYFAGNNPMFSNVFEISAAIVISFLARVLSTQSVFCYQAVASAGLILVLPGYIILCGSLELASKNMIAGSVRMVYAIIYSLFLGFGIAIGSDLYYFIDPQARKEMWLPLNTQTEVQGSFVFANETLPHWSGQFTFSNGTKNALNVGSINCERLAEWPWYRQPITPLWNILFVPLFSFLACFSLLHPFKSREVPVSIAIACIGYVTNLMANHYIFDRSDVVSAIGSFVIGLLGNAYSRLYDATAFTAMTVAILFLVPSGMAMAGGLAMTYKGSDGDLYSNGLSIGLRMVQVSIGITTGLFASALLVYMFGNKRKSAQLFAF